MLNINPHWAAEHRGQRISGIFDNERDLFSNKWGPNGYPDVVKIVTIGRTIRYIEDIDKRSRILVRLVDPVTDHIPGGFQTVQQAIDHAETCSRICAELADWASHYGWSGDRLIWENFLNEPHVGPGGDEKPEFTAVHNAEFLARNRRRGLMCNSLFQFGSGWPDNWDARLGMKDTYVDWGPYMSVIESMDKTKDNIGMHPYWPNSGVMGGGYEWFAGRYLQRPFMGVPIWFTEWGCDGGVNGGPVKTSWLDYPGQTADKANRYVNEIALARSLASRDPDCQQAFMFSFDGTREDWGHFDFFNGELLSRFLAYLRSPFNDVVWGDRRTSRWQWLVEPLATEAGLDPRVVATVLALESAGNPQADSSAHAAGLLQVMPKETGFTDRPSSYQLKSPTVGIRNGIAILKGSIAYTGSLARGLAGYYMGPGTAKTADLTKGDAAVYLNTFRYVWGQLWGSGCPIGDSNTNTPPANPPATGGSGVQVPKPPELPGTLPEYEAADPAKLAYWLEWGQRWEEWLNVYRLSTIKLAAKIRDS